MTLIATRPDGAKLLIENEQDWLITPDSRRVRVTAASVLARGYWQPVAPNVKVELGDSPGHPFRGNQYDGRVSAPLRESAFRGPTGQEMKRTEIGDTMEHLVVNHPKIQAVLTARFGAPARAIVGRQAKAKRQNPIDLLIGDNYAAELKSVHADSKDPGTKQKSKEITDKVNQAKELGRKGLQIGLLWEPTDDGYAAHLFVREGFAPGRFKTKFENLGSVPVTRQEYAVSYEVSAAGALGGFQAIQRLELGDKQGHPFRGNQYGRGRWKQRLARAGSTEAIDARREIMNRVYDYGISLETRIAFNDVAGRKADRQATQATPTPREHTVAITYLIEREKMSAEPKIKLYRGMSPTLLEKDPTDRFNLRPKTGSGQVPVDALSSWTTSRMVAREFGGYGIEAEVSVRDIAFDVGGKEKEVVVYTPETHRSGLVVKL